MKTDLQTKEYNIFQNKANGLGKGDLYTQKTIICGKRFRVEIIKFIKIVNIRESDCNG